MRAARVLFGVLLFAGGCGTGGAPCGPGGAAGNSGGATAGMAGAAGVAGGAGGASSCGPRGTYGGGETPLPNPSVTATIVDETGAPVSGAPVLICGTDLCSSPAMTDGAGHVSVSMTGSPKRAALRYGDGVHTAALAVPLHTSSTDFTALVTANLSRQSGAGFAPGAMTFVGDLTLNLAPGTVVSIDTLAYDTPDSQKLRAVSLPVASLGPLLADAPADVALVYGVAPAGTVLCPAAQVAVKLPHQTTAAYNDLGWAPGTAVEFWITTTDVGQTYAPYAGWAKISGGRVSADGGAVVTDDGPGNGFPVLETFAVRKAS